MVRLKGKLGAGLLGSSTSFQFLMVRLKVTKAVIHLSATIISIPYGAIKSLSLKTLYPIPFLFQFLMVRLKV